MKINFTEEDKESLLEILNSYKEIDDHLTMLKRQSDIIKEKSDALCNDFLEIQAREKELMSRMHELYGEFNLNDVYESIIYGK